MKKETFSFCADDATCNTTADSNNSAISPSPINPKPWPPAGVKPYYSDSHTCIILGDCRDILPTLEPVDLVLTDPPYGIDYDTSHSKYKNGISRSEIIGDKGPFDASHLPLLGDCILWGGNCFFSSLPASSTWLVWVKIARNNANIRQSDCELAWSNCIGRSRVFNHLWIGAYKASESGQRAEHPTQKPVILMRWCLALKPDARLILDPYMGSGTTLRAAKDLGRKAIGIEIEEKYCEIAAKRMSQSVLDFGSQPVKSEQTQLIIK